MPWPLPQFRPPADLSPSRLAAMEYVRPLADRSFAGVARAALADRELRHAVVAFWVLLAVAAAASVVAHRDLRRAGRASPMPHRGWLRALLAAALLLRASQLGHAAGCIEDEGLYAAILGTAVESGGASQVWFVTGSLGAWPVAALAIARAARSVGVEPWMALRLVTSACSVATAYFVARLAALLVPRWRRRGTASAAALDRVPALAALLALGSANTVLDGLYATYSPFAVLLLVIAAEHFARGVLLRAPRLLWASAMLLVASALARIFPALLVSPLALAGVLALVVARPHRRLVALHFVAPLAAASLVALVPQLPALLVAVAHAQWLATQVVVTKLRTPTQLAVEVGLELGLPALLVPVGAWRLLARRRRRARRPREATALAVGWLLVPVYTVASGTLFSIDKNLALACFLGAPLGAVALSRLVDGLDARTRGAVLAAVSVVLAGTSVVGARRLLPVGAAARPVRDWIDAHLRIPPAGARLVTVGPLSNPWGLKAEYDPRPDPRLVVSTATAFVPAPLEAYLALGAELVLEAQPETHTLPGVPFRRLGRYLVVPFTSPRPFATRLFVRDDVAPPALRDEAEAPTAGAVPAR